MTADVAKSKKTKSPAVPSYSLKDSFDDAKKLYKSFSHAVFNRPEIATTLDMSSASGSFTRRVFALTEYALIEESGDGYKVAERFLILHSNEPNTGTFRRAAVDAVRSSTVFEDLLSEFKTKLPPVGTVAQRLETQKKFNADRAKEAASVLERSLQFAGVLDSNNNILPVREGNGDTESRSSPPTAADPAGADVTERTEEKPPRGLRRSEVPLNEGRIAIVSYPQDLSKAEAEKIGRVLTALVD